MTSVLMVVSAAQHWTLKDGSKHPTGFWAEELVVPYETFRNADFEVTFATPGAQAPVVDKLSLGLTGGTMPKMRKHLEQQLVELKPFLDNPDDLTTINHDDFDLVFYPGGHGPMEDLAVDEASGALLNDRLRSGRPLALLCHAPAALMATSSPSSDANSASPFAGYKVTALSNIEERVNPFAWKAKWTVEDGLKDLGMDYSKGFPFRPYVVQDRNLFTGQNPQSSKKLAEALVKELNSK